MTIWIVYLTDDYEGWSVKAMFANEADAVACATALTEASKAQRAEIYEEEGNHVPYHSVYVAQAEHVFASLAEWHGAREAK